MTGLRVPAIALWCAFTGAFAQDDPRQAMRAAMEASAAKQRESVRRQAQASQIAPSGAPEDPGWYTVPWPTSRNWMQPLSPGSSATLPETSATWGSMPTPRASASLPCQPISPVALSPMIEDAAGREGLSRDLLTAVIRKESAFYPCAVSNKGAMGLMQLMPTTAATLGLSDPLDPSDNIAAGAKFLGQLLSRYGGDLSLALAAYNAGPGKVDAHGGVPPYPETKNYVRSIMTTLGASQ